jgi:hypothetical protein
MGAVCTYLHLPDVVCFQFSTTVHGVLTCKMLRILQLFLILHYLFLAVCGLILDRWFSECVLQVCWRCTLRISKSLGYLTTFFLINDITPFNVYYLYIGKKTFTFIISTQAYT